MGARGYLLWNPLGVYTPGARSRTGRRYTIVTWRSETS